MLARARRVITAWVTAVAAAVLLAVGAVTYLVAATTQESDIDRDLRYAARHAAVTSPPGCVWLIVTHQSAAHVSPGTPRGFPRLAALHDVAAGHPDIEQDLSVGGGRYRVLTTRRGQDVVQAVRDLHYETQSRRRLLLAVVVAEAIGLACAAAGGALLARRATVPLGDALLRQRRFVADASHELRTPLTRLHTRAQLLLRLTDNLALPEKVAADLRQLVANSRQLGDVIDDLLLSAQLGGAQGRASPRTDAVDLAALVEEICRDEQVRAEPAGLTLTAHLRSGACLVAGVESALRRAVSALVDNALAHTPRGGAVTVTVAAPDDGTVLLTVCDTGSGIDTGKAEQLFERFARGDSGRGRRFGIGLALVREVVVSHGGTIRADGAPGFGARFTVRLPALMPVRRPPAPCPASKRRGIGSDREATPH